MLRNFFQPLLRCAQAPLALETEGSRYHCDRQNAHFTGNLGDNRRCTRPSTAAHAGCNKNHIRAVQGVSNTIFILERRRTTHFRVGARAKSLGDARAQLQHGLGVNVR